jgi:hypothetical protein
MQLCQRQFCAGCERNCSHYNRVMGRVHTEPSVDCLNTLPVAIQLKRLIELLRIPARL